MNSDTRYRTLQLLKLRNGDDEQSTPAPPEDQIEGSKLIPKVLLIRNQMKKINFLNKQRNLFKQLLITQ